MDLRKLIARLILFLATVHVFEFVRGRLMNWATEATRERLEE